MARLVESVAPEFGDDLQVRIVVTKDLAGANRYYELSRALGRPAPVPSIFIEGKLLFDQTPGQEDLRACLKRFLGGAEQ